MWNIFPEPFRAEDAGKGTESFGACSPHSICSGKQKATQSEQAFLRASSTGGGMFISGLASSAWFPLLSM